MHITGIVSQEEVVAHEAVARCLYVMLSMVRGPERPMWSLEALRGMTREELVAIGEDNYRRRGVPQAFQWPS